MDSIKLAAYLKPAERLIFRCGKCSRRFIKEWSSAKKYPILPY